MHRITKLELSELNPCLTCRLCGGYFVDACTVQECLHSFCKSCIVKYLETKKNCPVCHVIIHKTKPLQNVRLDQTLQDLVYKIVPGIFKNEMTRRRSFYAERSGSPGSGNTVKCEDRGDIINPDHTIFTEDDKISVALTYSADGKPIPEMPVLPCGNRKEEVTKDGTSLSLTLGTHYLLCPAALSVGSLKKFIGVKFDLTEDDLIDIFQSDESLNEEYTLMDIAYIYTWRRRGPLRLFYTIYKFQPVRKKRRTLEEKSCNTNVPLADLSPTVPCQQDEPLNMSKKMQVKAEFSSEMTSFVSVSVVNEDQPSQSETKGNATLIGNGSSASIGDVINQGSNGEGMADSAVATVESSNVLDLCTGKRPPGEGSIASGSMGANC